MQKKAEVRLPLVLQGNHLFIKLRNVAARLVLTPIFPPMVLVNGRKCSNWKCYKDSKRLLFMVTIKTTSTVDTAKLLDSLCNPMAYIWGL